VFTRKGEYKMALSEFEKHQIREQKEKELSEQRRKREAFRELQSLPYGRKINIATTRIMEFYQTITIQHNANVHVSVGGLDSITLYVFVNKVLKEIYGVNAIGVSASTLEDKSIQAVHEELGLKTVKPLKSKVEVIRQYGYPVISKVVASKIEKLQNPTEDNATVRHAIMTGETGKQGGFRSGTRMKLPQKWLNLFAGKENDKYGTKYKQAPFKVSEKCCYYLKEKPCDDWAKQNNSYPYLGLMASEGGQRALSLPVNGCNYISEKTKRSCPFAIFDRQDLLRLALELNVPIPQIYGEIARKLDGTLYTTRAQRTGCSMCGFGVHLDKRPHHFDMLYEDNPKEWEFWMHEMGWGEVLSYIGVGWEQPIGSENGQISLFD